MIAWICWKLKIGWDLVSERDEAWFDGMAPRKWIRRTYRNPRSGEVRHAFDKTLYPPSM